MCWKHPEGWHREHIRIAGTWRGANQFALALESPPDRASIQGRVTPTWDDRQMMPSVPRNRILSTGHPQP